MKWGAGSDQAPHRTYRPAQNASRIQAPHAGRLAAHMVADAADGDEPGHALNQLVERNAVHVRMEPEQARWTVCRRWPN
jgi:hypothetical protein